MGRGSRKFPPGKGKYDVKLIAFVDEFWRKNYRPPSFREIMDGCNIPSTSVVRWTLRRLARDGIFLFVDDVARGVVPAWVKSAIEAQQM